MRPVIIHFVEAGLANQLVAGIPAAARAVHHIARLDRPDAPGWSCSLAVPGGWVPSDWCYTEIARLAPGAAVRAVDSHVDVPAPGAIHVSGERLVIEPATVIAELEAEMSPSATAPPGPAPAPAMDGDVRELRMALLRAGTAIVKSTGKKGDGIVSRTINRPISQSITRRLLHIRGITPFHATIVTALLGIAMAAALFAGGANGLVVGALLFQAASIADGVDGEIARATFRASPAGASLDSAIDALTNLAFVAGLSFNLFHLGDTVGSVAGASGLAIMALGLFVIGRRARQSGGALSFDGVKDHFREKDSALMRWLTWLTMRDFYAAAAALLVVVGLATEMLLIFVTVATGWLGVTLSVILRSPGRHVMKLKP